MEVPSDLRSLLSSLTEYNVHKKYDEGSLERAILRKKPERVYERRLDDEGEAHLIALACSKPPKGYEVGVCVC